MALAKKIIEEGMVIIHDSNSSSKVCGRSTNLHHMTFNEDMLSLNERTCFTELFNDRFLQMCAFIYNVCLRVVSKDDYRRS